MIIDCISDLHGYYPELEGGDLLIVAGDLTRSDESYQYEFLYEILKEKNYKKIIIIAGNHDNCLQNGQVEFVEDSMIEYLCDSGTEVLYHRGLDPVNYRKIGVPYKRKTLKVWGSPWTLKFAAMNPNCTAFTCDTEEELAEKWALIPDDVDILVTHGSPYGVLDKTEGGECVGSKSLQMELYKRQFPNLKLHVFGHVHEGYGIDAPRWDDSDYKRVNCSHVNGRYEPLNKPIRITL